MKTMQKIWTNKNIDMNILNDNKGFTLVEAIITIALVGIVIVPISMIFQGVLADTIETRELLKANQVAQQYVESFRAMDYSLLENISSDNIISDEEIALHNLPEGLEGYDLTIQVINNPLDAEFTTGFGNDTETIRSEETYSDDFQMPALDFIPVDYDIMINLFQINHSGFEIYNREDKFGEEEYVHKVAGAPSTSRDITIKYSDGSGGGYSLDVEGWVYTFDDSTLEKSATHDVVIYCDYINTPPTHKTTITVQNYTDKHLKVWIFRAEEPILTENDFEVIEAEGDMFIFDRMETADVKSHRIYEIIVRVEKDGEEIANVTTTVVAK